MFKKLNHVGVAVKNLSDSTNLFAKLLEISAVDTEEVPGQNVRLSFFHIGETSIELTEATSLDSPIARFIEKRGEGVHHLSFEVDDIRAEMKRLKDEGFHLIDEQPRLGAGDHWVAFLHPRSTNGVLVEISQKRKESTC